MRLTSYIAIIIFISGLLIGGAVLLSSDFAEKTLATGSANLNWSERVGDAIAFPACGSSGINPPITCSGGSPSVTFNWTNSGGSCQAAYITVSGNQIASGLPCSGSYTWAGGSPNTNYTYGIYDIATVCVGGGEGGCVYENLSHLISSGSFSTPSCIPPPPPCGSGSVGGWSSCSASCGGGVQTRTVTHSDCTTATKIQSCNTQACVPPVPPVPPGAGSGGVSSTVSTTGGGSASSTTSTPTIIEILPR